MPIKGELVGPFPPGADPDAYDRERRRILWQLPMGIYLLGSVDSSGERRNFMTLNWLMQVSTRPKQVAISVEQAAFSHELVRDSGLFAISLVSRDDRAVVRKFVKPAVHDPEAKTLNDVEYTTATTGAPIAGIAVGWLDCEVRHEVDAGSHRVFVGEVVDAGGPSGEPVPILRMEDTRMSYGG